MKAREDNPVAADEDPFDALSNPVVRAAVDQAMEPYRGMVTPEMFEEMRQALADTLVVHPVTHRLVRSLSPRTNVVSGEERVDVGAKEAGSTDVGSGEVESSGRKVG